MATIRAPRPRRSEPASFKEVRPERSTADFRKTVQQALEVLRTSKTEVGRATYAYVTTGRVKVDELNDLTRPDYHRVRRDLKKWTDALRPEAYESLANPRSPASKALDRLLNGYMWDDRIYVAKGLSPQKLASTLVHEVNHFLNRSEENYRGDTNALLEEYRAFYVEKLFKGEEMTPAKCRKLKEEVAREYGLDKARLGEIPDVPPGVLVPPTARRGGGGGR